MRALTYFKNVDTSVLFAVPMLVTFVAFAMGSLWNSMPLMIATGVMSLLNIVGLAWVSHLKSAARREQAADSPCHCACHDSNRSVSL